MVRFKYTPSYIITKLPAQWHLFLFVHFSFDCGCFFFHRSARSCKGFCLHGASPRCKNETADSIIRSDGKSLCKVFCIITYQSKNSHPQILWVTKHRQLPHYCPPKSSPNDDRETGGRRAAEREKIV